MIPTSQNYYDKTKERRARSKETMFTGFQPIFRICRVFGLLPFSIVFNLNAEIESCKVKRVDCVWFAISICVYLPLVIFNYHVLCLNIDKHQRNATFVLIMGNYLLQLFTLISTALFFIVNMYNRDKFVDILKNLEHFDKEASEFWRHFEKNMARTQCDQLFFRC